MKKKILLIVIAILLLATVAVCATVLGMEKPRAVMSYLVGLSDEAPEYADANGDGDINVLDVIYLVKNARVDLFDANGEKITEKNVLELAKGSTYALSAVSTVSDSDTFTWATTDNKVAAIDSNGSITALNAGQCTVSVKTASGEEESVNVVVYETVAEKVTYRWDFNDLTENNEGNDLTLNPSCPANAANNYTISNGLYVASSSAATLERPDFLLKTPITFDSTRDFTLEWQGIIPTGTGHTILGSAPVDTSTDASTPDHIYVSPRANWKNPDPTYAVKFYTGKKQILLPFTEYLSTMESSELVAWKINYVASTKKMSLSFSTDSGATWTQTCEVSVGTFSATYDSIFGRTTDNGKYNFRGTMDYIEVTCYKNTRVVNKDNLDVTYRWDFNDLTETYNGNDLTLNTQCPDGVGSNYTIANGSYKVKSGLTDLNKPDFTMETPFTLGSTFDWAVEWKGNFVYTGTVIGKVGTDTTAATDTAGHIYISPSANWNWKDANNPVYGVKFQYATGKNVVLPYTPFVSVMKTMSTWRIEYDAASKLATLSFSQDNGASWTVASKTAMPTFSTEFTNVFGRTLQNGKYNFNSEMDYIQISLNKESATNGVVFTSLALDDNNYTLSYNKNKTDYTVYIPEGHPAIPRLEGTAADGYTYEIQQAYIPEGKTEGTAIAVVSDGQKSTTYTVKFVKTESLGFVLQFDDRFTFVPDYKLKAGESFTFESSDSTILTVDENGVIAAVKRCDTPVTVTAKVGGTAVDTLTVDRVERAHINLFFITGQSNGQGCYDTVNYDGTTETEGNEWMIPYLDQLAAVEKIGGEGRVYSYDVHPRAENIREGLPEAYTLYDMNNYAKQGHSAPLGKAYYDLTGEKVIFLQSAWSGAPIESWLDPDRYEEAGGYGLATRNFYQTTKDGYNKLMALISADYEIILKANFWCQGETAMSSYYDKSISNYIFSSNASYDKSKLITAETYYEYFMRIDKDMRADYGLDYNGIMFTKTKGSATDTDIVPIVSAYFGLVTNNDGIFTATRRFIEIATQYKTGDPTKEGYGFMGTDGAKGNHYNQIGYNYHGNEAANNLFGVVYKRFDNAESVEIIDNNGQDRLNSENSFEIKAGDIYRLGALPKPYYTNEKLTWTTSDATVATVDKMGAVKGVGVGTAVITVTTESGKSQSVNVKVYETVAEKVKYRWDFDDLTEEYNGNDLTLDPMLPANSSDNYTITDGIYSVNSSAATLERPNFILDTPFEINDAFDWSIEWKGYFLAGTGNTLFGQISDDASADTDIKGHIYCSPSANWGSSTSPKYCIKFLPESGSQSLFVYTEYLDKITSMNTWRIAYDAATNKATLSFLNEDGTTWTVASTVTMGEFSSVFESMFGRTRRNARYNFKGEMDYIEVNCYKFTEVREKENVDVAYRWDFNDYTDSVGGNDLTLNPACPDITTTRISLQDGMFVVSSSTKDTERPDFIMDEAFTIDSTKDWEIQWKGHFLWAGTLFGQNPEDTSTATEVSNKGFIYIPPSASTNWGSSTNVIHAMKFFPSGASNYTLLPFTGYQPLMTSVNTWRLSYKATEKAIVISVSLDDGGSWEICSRTPMGDYSATFTNLFGRSYNNGKYSFIGEMDYVQVSLAK
ncbi:MAG: hypothetical protein E7615_03100 [Ruminococcaceae bacterium]|nr:hypothetical protein [Oscillospiraceae bacterium]